MMKTFVTVGCAMVFVAGAAWLLLGEQPHVRLMGAAAFGVLLFVVLGAFLYTGQIQTNWRQVDRRQSPGAYWTNIFLYIAFAAALLVVMILAASGYIPIRAPL